jgi:hypothetical protein
MGIRRRPYYLYDAATGALDEQVPCVVVTRDGVRLGARAAHRARVGDDAVAWEEASDGWWSSGRLEFDRAGLEGRGTLAVGTSADRALERAVVASAIPPTAYETTISDRREPDSPLEPGSGGGAGWRPGLELDLGYRYDGTFPTTLVLLDGQDLSIYVALDVDGQDRLVLGIDAASEATLVCEFDPSLYVTSKVTFSPFGDSFAGRVSSTCADREGEGAYLWVGTATNPLVKELAQA